MTKKKKKALPPLPPPKKKRGIIKREERGYKEGKKTRVWCLEGLPGTREKCVPVPTISRGSHPRGDTQRPPLSVQLLLSVWSPKSERVPHGDCERKQVYSLVISTCAAPLCQQGPLKWKVRLEYDTRGITNLCYLVSAKLLWKRHSNPIYHVNVKLLLYFGTFCNQEYICMHPSRHFYYMKFIAC